MKQNCFRVVLLVAVACVAFLPEMLLFAEAQPKPPIQENSVGLFALSFADNGDPTLLNTRTGEIYYYSWKDEKFSWRYLAPPWKGKVELR